MIIGAHSILYSKVPAADRAFLRDVLGFPSVDVGDGWLIFGLPPSEVAIHPSEKNDVHEFYLMCDDVEALVEDLARRKVACGPIQDQGWGLLTQVTLPGGGRLGIYEPRHARPRTGSVRKTQGRTRAARKKAARKTRARTKTATRRRR